MLCGNCKKNQATKTYEQIKKAKREVFYYCLDCYHKLFLDIDESSCGEKRTACPYCGTAVTDLKKRNLVGCAKCYEMMQSYLVPVITKLQGSQVHTGKAPYETKREIIERRQKELKSLSQKYKTEKDYESARAYDERFIQLENGLEEDYVWRNRLNLSKQS